MILSFMHQILLGNKEGACGGQVGKEGHRGLKCYVRCRWSDSNALEMILASSSTPTGVLSGKMTSSVPIVVSPPIPSRSR